MKQRESQVVEAAPHRTPDKMVVQVQVETVTGQRFDWLEDVLREYDSWAQFYWKNGECIESRENQADELQE